MRDEDLPIFFEHQLDPEATRMAAFESRDREAFMAHWAKILRDETVLVKTVVVDGEVAGNVVSFESPVTGKREIGYWIGREHWGRGVGTRALSQFLDQEATRPLYAGVATHNAASIRILEKCGFVLWDEDLGPSNKPPDEVEEVLLRLE
ncbi:MAG: GNAT family N-acetyltransferase [Actinomycetota bacterium]|nr:GNAT family N-acetyltransferase [Actinomycetota bacterium]